MIQSMTGFGSGQATGEAGVVNIDIKSVNSRYLDLTFRMPDELRLAEIPLRALIAQSVARGKIEVRASFSRPTKDLAEQVSPEVLQRVQAAYEQMKASLPQTPAPTFADIMQCSGLSQNVTDPASWVPLCQTAATEAIEQLIQTRAREGERLVQIMSQYASEVQAIVDSLKASLPELLQVQSERIAKRIREALEQATPQGMEHITGIEISERINAESSLFSLRADVAEELDRLGLHVNELTRTLETAELQASDKTKPSKGVGKRLDFLFQEMNREANTLGSKAVDIRLTRAAVDLKLLIEQMREQIQNIE